MFNPDDPADCDGGASLHARGSGRSFEERRDCDPLFPALSRTPSMIHSTESVAAALVKAGITIPAVPKPAGAYVGAIRTGNLVVTSGQLPWVDGKLLHVGRIGAEVSEAEGKACARICAINALAQFQAAIGDLEAIRRIVRVEGFVHCAPGYRGHPRVLDGASHLFNELFGDRGIHTRVALGITEMPFDAPVQLVIWAEVA